MFLFLAFPVFGPWIPWCATALVRLILRAAPGHPLAAALSLSGPSARVLRARLAAPGSFLPIAAGILRASLIIEHRTPPFAL